MTQVFKLHRRDADTTSKDSAKKLDVTRMEKIVYDVIDNYGNSGCIQDDVLRDLNSYSYSTVTARFKALEEKMLIVRCDHTRKGKSNRRQRIMMSKRFYDFHNQMSDDELQQGLLGV
tara:strand:- start:3794 stop:4144 length:351 start_codon:yes stop_codon:yes gene_type:complete